MVVWALSVIVAGFLVSRGCSKTFPGPGCLCSEDGVVGLWHLLVNLCIYSSPFHLATAPSLWAVLRGRDSGLSTPGFYPNTFLQPVNGSKNSILNWVLKLNLLKSLQVFFSYVCLDRSFILLHHCYSYKPQIRTKQTGLTNRFVITGKNICSCAQKIKNMLVVQMLFFFGSAYVTYSLVERLCYSAAKPWERRSVTVSEDL